MNTSIPKNNPEQCIGTAENRRFLKQQCEKLLLFGHDFPSPGGGAYWLGDDGKPVKDRPRETWITARMAHVYSLGVFLGHSGSEALAETAIRGLLGELHDDQNGGWYAGRTAQDGILPGKQCYAHAFVILAGTSGVLARIPGAGQLLEEALAVYDRFFWNEAEGLSADTWDTSFSVLEDYRGLNANMHTVEAFLAVADVTKDETYRVRAGKIIDRVLNWASGNNWRIPEHYSSAWEPNLECNADRPADPFKPYGATPGHGIEWARLITQWALSIFPDAAGLDHDTSPKASYIAAAQALFDRAIADAWNVDGAPGIVYTTGWDGSPIVHDRMHWTLAEAINTAATLYHVTGRETYAELYHDFLQYLSALVIDPVNGSWYHQLDEHNNVLRTVWPGKPDLYHAVQAMLIPCAPAGLSIAPALKAASSRQE